MKNHTKYLSNRYLNIFLLLSILFGISSCVEEIELRTQGFESLLVIEANITNENKQQTVFISRTFRFEDDGPSPETDSHVSIYGNGKLVTEFSEDSPGTYISNQAFSAQPNIDYTLEINTSNGRSYVSEISRLPVQANIESISVQPSQDDFNNQGVAILANTYSPKGQGNFYKFEYEETYKIIAPFWTIQELYTEDKFDLGNCLVIEGIKQKEERVCFNSEKSNEIILAETIGQPQDRLNNFETRFIKLDNTIIAHRYSILLKLHVISPEAHNYFKRRIELSSENNLFSQVQPGFIEGNIKSKQDPDDEKVIGVFYTSTVSESRFYFNWADLFPNQNPPRIPCQLFSPPLRNESSCGSIPTTNCCPLKSLVVNNFVKHVEQNLNPQEGDGPYIVVRRECGDCTAVGSNIVPDFWEE